MLFRILVKAGSKKWWESYNEDIDDPYIWAKETVKWFNQTLKPYEQKRMLLRVSRLIRRKGK